MGRKFKVRTYKCVARIPHWCIRCCRYIEPGEAYEALVEITGGKFMLFKYHIDPACDFTPDPEDDRMSDTIEEPFKMAA